MIREVQFSDMRFVDKALTRQKLSRFEENRKLWLVAEERNENSRCGNTHRHSSINFSGECYPVKKRKLLRCSQNFVVLVAAVTRRWFLPSQYRHFTWWKIFGTVFPLTAPADIPLPQRSVIPAETAYYATFYAEDHIPFT